MEVNYTFSVLSLQRLLEILERRHENHLRDDQCRVTTMSNTFILFYKSCFLLRPVSSWRCLPWTGGRTRSTSRPATPWTSSSSWSGSYSSTSWRCAASWSPPSTNKSRYRKYVYCTHPSLCPVGMQRFKKHLSHLSEVKQLSQQEYLLIKCTQTPGI